jgi:hypothetical protein
VLLLRDRLDEALGVKPTKLTALVAQFGREEAERMFVTNEAGVGMVLIAKHKRLGKNLRRNVFADKLPKIFVKFNLPGLFAGFPSLFTYSHQCDLGDWHTGIQSPGRS